MKTPEPKPLTIVCSVCGLDWKAHGKTPSLEKCVDLLKAELAKKPSHIYTTNWAAPPTQFYWNTSGGNPAI